MTDESANTVASQFANSKSIPGLVGSAGYRILCGLHTGIGVIPADLLQGPILWVE